jgi:hypothetical protein
LFLNKTVASGHIGLEASSTGDFAMPGMMLMRGTLSAIGTLFGGLGVFFLYYSFLRPEMAVYALMFLGTASAIAWSTPK